MSKVTHFVPGWAVDFPNGAWPTGAPEGYGVNGARHSRVPVEIIRHSTIAAPTGITDPPIDRLLERADSKYALVLYSAKRARQINAYYSQLNEGLLEYVGPLVDTRPQEKPLSIAMREIDAGLLTSEATEG